MGDMDGASALGFLTEMFPTQSPEQLQQLLVQHGGNLDDVVQTCLAIEARSDESDATAADGDGDGDGDASTGGDAPAAEAMVSLVPVSQGEAMDDNNGDGMMVDQEAANEVQELSSFPSRPSSPLSASVAGLRELLVAVPAVPAASYTSSVRALLHCVSNVLEHPSVEKYRLLPYSHAKFRARIGAGDERLLHRAKVVLLRAGFSDIAIPSDGGGGSAASAASSSSHQAEDGFLLMTDEQRHVPTLQRAKALLEQQLQTMHSPQSSSSETPAAAPASPSLRLVPTAAAASSSSSAAAAAAASSSSAAATAAAPRLAAALPIAHPVSAAAPSRISDSLLYTPLSTLKKQFKRKSGAHAAAAPPPTLKLTREQMAAKVAQRLGGGGKADASAPAPSSDGGAAAPASAPAAPTVRAGRIMDLAHTAALRAQIDSVRRSKHARRTAQSQAQGRKRVFTVADLAAMEEADIKARSVFGSAGMPGAGAAASAGPSSKFRTLSDIAVGSPADCLAAGKEMLRLTNEFRAREGKKPLQWHQSLHDIGLVHSRRMAMGEVAFGHDGAKQRFAAYPFRSSSAAENVAWSSGMPFEQLARTHVQGWIDSPGHRKNMLAHHNWCAIAVFRNPQGAYYSTQLFGLG